MEIFFRSITVGIGPEHIHESSDKLIVMPGPTLLVDIRKFRGMPSQSVVIDGLALEKTPDPYPLAHIPGVAVGGHTAAGSVELLDSGYG